LRTIARLNAKASPDCDKFYFADQSLFPTNAN
jgi:hypothetical protein